MTQDDFESVSDDLSAAQAYVRSLIKNAGQCNEITQWAQCALHNLQACADVLSRVTPS